MIAMIDVRPALIRSCRHLRWETAWWLAPALWPSSYWWRSQGALDLGMVTRLFACHRKFYTAICLSQVIPSRGPASLATSTEYSRRSTEPTSAFPSESARAPNSPA